MFRLWLSFTVESQNFHNEYFLTWFNLFDFNSHAPILQRIITVESGRKINLNMRNEIPWNSQVKWDKNCFTIRRHVTDHFQFRSLRSTTFSRAFRHRITWRVFVYIPDFYCNLQALKFSPNTAVKQILARNSETCSR